MAGPKTKMCSKMKVRMNWAAMSLYIILARVCINLGPEPELELSLF